MLTHHPTAACKKLRPRRGRSASAIVEGDVELPIVPFLLGQESGSVIPIMVYGRIPHGVRGPKGDKKTD